MATPFPGRGQQGPQYWDVQLKGYIDERVTPETVEANLPSRLSPASLNTTIDTRTERVVNMGLLSGAVGDGITDNTAIFQAEFDKVGNAGAPVTFFFPAGTWLTGPLHVKSNTILRGVGAGSFGLSSFDGSRTTVLKLKANSTEALISDYSTVALSSGVVIQDMQLLGNKVNQTSASAHGIQLYPAASGQDPLWKISRVYVNGFKGDGINVGFFRRAAKIIDCEVLNNDGYGIYVDATDCTVQNCAIGQNTKDGIRFMASLQHCIGNDIWGNDNGISLGPLAQCTMIVNCGIDINRKHGITTEAPRTVISACTFQTNGISANDTYSHIDLGFPGTTAIGCTISSVAMRHDATVSANKAKYGIQSNVQASVFGVAFNPADLPWVSGLNGNAALLVLASRTQGIQDGVTLHMGLPGGSGVKLGGGATEKMGFWGATAIVRPTGTPAAATDLATALTLVNDLRSKLISLGLIS